MWIPNLDWRVEIKRERERESECVCGGGGAGRGGERERELGETHLPNHPLPPTYLPPHSRVHSFTHQQIASAETHPATLDGG